MQKMQCHFVKLSSAIETRSCIHALKGYLFATLTEVSAPEMILFVEFVG